MTLINPFEEVVVFGKAHSTLETSWGTNVRVIAALVPTGRHVSHANALTHKHNSRGKGGRATRLQRYSKALTPGAPARAIFGGPASKQMPAGLTRRGVKRGLQLATTPSKPPTP